MHLGGGKSYGSRMGRRRLRNSGARVKITDNDRGSRSSSIHYNSLGPGQERGKKTSKKRKGKKT